MVKNAPNTSEKVGGFDNRVNAGAMFRLNPEAEELQRTLVPANDLQRSGPLNGAWVGIVFTTCAITAEIGAGKEVG